MRGDERLAGGGPAVAGRVRGPRLRPLARRHVRPGAASAAGRRGAGHRRQAAAPHLERPTCPTAGRPRCCSRRRRDTLLCGDLLTQAGPATLLRDDVVGPAVETEQMFRAMSMAPQTVVDAARPRRPAADDAGDHARRVVRRRWRRRAARAGRRPRCGCTEPPTWPPTLQREPHGGWGRRETDEEHHTGPFVAGARRLGVLRHVARRRRRRLLGRRRCGVHDHGRRGGDDGRGVDHHGGVDDDVGQ